MNFEIQSQGKGAITNASWNAFFTLFNIITSFFIAPLMIHHLGSAQYGILILMWSITGLLGIMSFGLGEATLRYVAHYCGKGDMAGINRVFGSTLSFYAVICSVVVGTMFAAAPVIASVLKIPTNQYNS